MIGHERLDAIRRLVIPGLRVRFDFRNTELASTWIRPVVDGPVGLWHHPGDSGRGLRRLDCGRAVDATEPFNEVHADSIPDHQRCPGCVGV